MIGLWLAVRSAHLQFVGPASALSQTDATVEVLLKAQSFVQWQNLEPTDYEIRYDTALDWENPGATFERWNLRASAMYHATPVRFPSPPTGGAPLTQPGSAEDRGRRRRLRGVKWDYDPPSGTAFLSPRSYDFWDEPVQPGHHLTGGLCAVLQSAAQHLRTRDLSLSCLGKVRDVTGAPVAFAYETREGTLRDLLTDLIGRHQLRIGAAYVANSAWTRDPSNDVLYVWLRVGGLKTDLPIGPDLKTNRRWSDLTQCLPD